MICVPGPLWSVTAAHVPSGGGNTTKPLWGVVVPLTTKKLPLPESVGIQPKVQTFNFRSLPAAVALASLALPAAAQNLTLEEVVITAQKRTESLMDVPLSVSAVGGEKMIEAGIKNLGDLTAYVPNFQMAETSIGNYLSIRGISSGINQGFEQSVVQYMDDVALGRSPLARAPFMDLNRVEVLRGLHPFRQYHF